MADVFISYHEKSAGELVRKIADELEQGGISCWYAQRDMIPGQFVNSIMEAIRHCKVFLLILNEEANQSKYVFNELSNAYRRFEDGIIILPFQIGEFQVSDNVQFFLTTLHIINGGNSLEAVHTEELTRKIAESLGKTLIHQETLTSTPPDTQELPETKEGKPELKPEEELQEEQKQEQKLQDLLAVGISIVIVCSILIGLCWFALYSMYNSTWKVEDTTLTIYYNGKMNYGSKFVQFILKIPSGSPPWYEYSATVTKVIINDGVTDIGANAFYNFSRLETVKIPNSVTNIELGAFSDCSRLKEIQIPSSVTKIESFAFSNCYRLSFVTIPEGVNYIGAYAFEDCSSLSGVSIPDSVTYISIGAFEGCNLDSVSIPETADITEQNNDDDWAPSFDSDTTIIRRPVNSAE